MPRPATSCRRRFFGCGSVRRQGANKDETEGSHQINRSRRGGDRSFTDDPPWELANIYQQTYDLGARVHSDSWGWESTFQYEEPCAKADLSRVKETYVKSIVRCAEDLGFKTEVEADKTVSVDEGGKSLTVEVVPPSGPAAAFVRIVIPSVNG